jgi:hypothetical protein
MSTNPTIQQITRKLLPEIRQIEHESDHLEFRVSRLLEKALRDPGNLTFIAMDRITHSTPSMGITYEIKI